MAKAVMLQGTYLHGLFATDAFRRRYLAGLGAVATTASYSATIDEALDSIADRLARVLDSDALLGLASRR